MLKAAASAKMSKRIVVMTHIVVILKITMMMLSW